ncbi:Site-specific DNA recombinase [Sphingomonas sp. YR710]|uniref:recombinase family protein n=1 Tax=Sphingomonas sp. YR710 TaxID=1882773 RepID=UPI00088873DD|nr:recombinase family protein [Sphingomonas sp. YR710]SDD91611.1 Site-specific DNA recombinase [Sphingomonas sp. YR710]
MLIGYARVSSTDQSLDIQRAALAAAGVEKLFCEKASGRSADDRPELQACVEFARSGDTVIVTKLDRFARSTRDLHNLLATLDAKDVGFRCLDQAIDTTSSTGRLTLAILGAVAAFELDIRAERQREGIEAARRKGLYQGRKSQIDLERVKQLSTRMKPSEVAAVMQISRASVYRAIAALAEMQQQAA